MTSRPRSITTAGRRCRAGAGRSAIAAMMRNRSRRNDESLEQSSASGIVSVMNRIARPLLSDTVPPGLVRIDRKSVVEGKSVSVRVDLGGRRLIKKKKHNKRQKY